MNIKNLTRMVLKGFYSVTEVLVWIGYTALAGIILIVFVDVCGRYFLNKPLPGAYELVLLAMTILGGFAIMYTAVQRGHIAIDLLVVRLSRRTQIIMQSVTSLLGFGVWAVLAYQTYLRALGLPETSGVLNIPVAPFLLTLAAATFLCCLTLLIQTFYPAVSEDSEKRKQESQNES